VDLSNNSHEKSILMKVKAASPPEAEGFIDRLLAEEEDVLIKTISDPSVLDLLWGRFFGSGDERCVQRIISVLPWLQDRSNATKMLVGGAAQWSLTSNAMQHQRVMEICRREVATQPDEIKMVLREIIHRAEDELAKKR